METPAAASSEPAAKERNLSVTMAADYPVWLTGEELNENTTYAVLGHYEKYLENYNGDRDISDASKESELYYSENRKYEFAIDKVIKGTIEEPSIVVSKCYSIGEVLNDTTGKEIPVTLPYPYFTEPEYGSTRIILLNYDPATETYFTVGEPWEFAVSDGQVQVISRVFGSEDAVSALQDVQQDDTLYHISVSYGNSHYEEPFSGMKVDEFLEFFR
ncbi:MAG: hypothetical protein HUJ80_05045 [Firmicutes bacterium]|nr:hypothetical protein [Bacillota bacterium]